jgi:hypothetical protein
MNDTAHAYIDDANLLHAAELAREASVLLRGGMDPAVAAKLLAAALDAVRASHRAEAARGRRVSSARQARARTDSHVDSRPARI